MQQLARRVSVTPQTIRNWELNRTRIELRYYPTIFKWLGYNPLPKARTPGELVRKARLTRGLSKAELADQTGVDEATIARLELNTLGMTRRTVAKVIASLRGEVDPTP